MKTLLFFKSTRDVIAAEKILEESSFSIEVLPVPKNLSSECGMCLEIDEGDSEAAVQLLRSRSLAVQARRGTSFDLMSTVEQDG